MTAPTGSAVVNAQQPTPLAPLPLVNVPATWDPFQLMDRMDEDALQAEIEGRTSEELVYVVKEGGQEVVGLSKRGVDECCMMLVGQGQVIREEDITYDMLGEGEDAEAVFKCKAARYAVSPQGEVKLDQVIGVKRQPLWYVAAEQLTLDSTVPSKKYRGRTYREMLANDEGRDYLSWMANNFREDAVKEFVVRILAGEDARIQPGRQKNPHWYEHGSMKAARNARFRLIPGNVRSAVIVSARQGGKTREVDRTQAARQQAQATPIRRDVVAVMNTPLPGDASAFGGYGGKPLREVPKELLAACSNWAMEKQQDFAIALEGGGLEPNVRVGYEKDYARMGEIGRRCALVIGAYERGEMQEPPHKDGRPREQAAGEGGNGGA